mgnify:FL=1
MQDTYLQPLWWIAIQTNDTGSTKVQECVTDRRCCLRMSLNAGVAAVVVLFNYTVIAGVQYAKAFLANRRAREMTNEYDDLVAARKIQRVEKPERVYEPEQYYEFMPQK